jgi:hypothetical protein
MFTPRPRGARRLTIAVLAAVLIASGISSAVAPTPGHVALAKDADVLGDTLILAGPGGQYGILTVAPAGAVVSVDGEAVDGYYPVTYEGVSGWTAEGLLAMKGDGNGKDGGGGGGNGGGGGDGDGNGGGGGGNGGGNASTGNGGVETVSAEPVYTAGGEPVQPAASEPTDTPVSGGEYGPGGGGYSENQIVDIIYEAADNYGQSREDMLRVARCESGLDPYAVGGGGAYHGLYQFVPSTFAGTPYGEYDIYDAWANANAAGWMWAEGRKGDWVCQ